MIADSVVRVVKYGDGQMEIFSSFMLNVLKIHVDDVESLRYWYHMKIMTEPILFGIIHTSQLFIISEGKPEIAFLLSSSHELLKFITRLLTLLDTD